VSRPRSDRIADFLRVADYLAEYPDASASSVARSLRIRKGEALRIVRGLRERERRFPNAQRPSSAPVEEAE
jgi:hypothetical protein